MLNALRVIRVATTMSPASMMTSVLIVGLAMMNLGYASHHGNGVPQDYQRAEELYLESIENSSWPISDGYTQKLLGDLFGDNQNPNQSNFLELMRMTSL